MPFQTNAADLPAFPGAQGHGSKTVGGSGRHLSKPATTIFRITSLKDSGVGTLRECAEAKMPRVCIFETSGEIRLTNELRIKFPYLTIAGQTAPSPGIMLRGAGIRVASHDVLIQHLQVRPGDDKGGMDPGRRDGVTVGGSNAVAAYNVLVDHLSVTWAIDENVSTWHPLTRDVTFSNLLIAEGLENSIHPEGKHSKGIMIGDNSTRVSIHNCLLAHNWDRNPDLKPATSTEFVNNIVYDWGGPSPSNAVNLSDYAKTGAPVLLNFIGNNFKRGSSTPFHPVIYASPPASKTKVYSIANVGPTRPTDSGSDWLISGLKDTFRSTSAVVQPSGITVRTPAAAFEYVLANVGSRPKDRSPVDTRIVQETKNGTGTIKDCVGGCARNAGGWPSLKVVARKLSTPSDPFGDADKDGYTNLEEWLQMYAAQVQ